jgi:hypothetical protein
MPPALSTWKAAVRPNRLNLNISTIFDKIIKQKEAGIIGERIESCPVLKN